MRPPYSLTTLLAGLDPETQGFAQALLAQRERDFEGLDRRDLDYEVERLIIDLEAIALEERSEYNQAAQAEAEHDGDSDSLSRPVGHQGQAPGPPIGLWSRLNDSAHNSEA